MALRLTLVLLLLVSNSAWANWLRSPFFGVRQAGMADALIAVADDKTALWGNPAGLSRPTGLMIDYYDFVLGADSGDSFSRFYQAMVHQIRQEAIRSDTQFSRFSFSPAVIGQYFAIQPYFQTDMLADLQNLTASQVDLYSATDIGLIGGGAVTLGKKFSIGASARVVLRSGIDVTDTPENVISYLETTEADMIANLWDVTGAKLGKGYAVGFNLGVLFRSDPHPQKPSFNIGIALHDIGNTSFGVYDEGRAAPATIPASYHAGIAWLIPLQGGKALNFALDYQHLFGQEPWIKSTHFGVEYRFRFGSLRAGLSQGHPCFGLGFELGLLSIQAATYAVELGNAPWERGYRWYLLQISLGQRWAGGSRSTNDIKGLMNSI